MSSVGAEECAGQAQRAAVDAADAAGGEDADPRRRGRDHRRRDGRRRPAAAGEGEREARPGGLHHALGRGERHELSPVEADEDPAALDRDGRRDGAALADGAPRPRGPPRRSAGTAGRG